MRGNELLREATCGTERSAAAGEARGQGQHANPKRRRDREGGAPPAARSAGRSAPGTAPPGRGARPEVRGGCRREEPSFGLPWSEGRLGAVCWVVRSAGQCLRRAVPPPGCSRLRSATEKKMDLCENFEDKGRDSDGF